MKRGISLLEVLFSIFVLSVGLLGLAAMVPVGKHQVTEASHADRGTAIGQAAFRDMKIRDMLDPVSAFVIDPLAVTRNVAQSTPDSEYGVFPHGPANFPAPAAPAFPKPARINAADVGFAVPYSQPMADRIFRCVDDLQFEFPEDETRRPVLVNPNGTPTHMSAGDYSWMAMLTPQRTTGELNTFKATVVVFYRRDLVVDTSDINTPASERIVYCDLVNGGVGGSSGGDVQLRVVNTTATAQQADKILKVRPNHWIMVSNQHAGTGDTTHNWYRVVSTSELQSTASPWVIDVTLAGPDLPATRKDGTVTTVLMRDIDGDSANGYTCHATICDGVIGVFEKAVKLDEPSAWSAH
jgi:hypothetical protein